MAFVVAEPCIWTKDRACVEVCPVECFYEGEDQLYIHPEECIDCAACEPACPVTAIFPADSVPDQWKHYIQKNIDFFKANPDSPKALTKTMRGNQDNFARVFTVEGKTIKLPPPPPGYPAPVAKAEAAPAEAKVEAKMEAPKAEAPKVEAPKAEAAPKVEPKVEAPPKPKEEVPKPAPAVQPVAVAASPDILAQVAEVAAKAAEAAAAAAKAAEAAVAALKALQGKAEGRAGTGAPSAQAVPPQVKAAEPKKVEAAPAKAAAPASPKVETAAPKPTAKPEPAKPVLDLQSYEKAKDVILNLVEMLSGARELDFAFVAEAEKFAGELKTQVAKEFGKEVFTASELEKKDPILRQKHDLANAILERVEAVNLLAQYHRRRRPIYEYAVGGLLTGAVALTCQLFAFWIAIESASIPIPTPTIGAYLKAALTAALTPEGLVPFLGFSTLAGLMGLFPLYAAYKIFSLWRELKALREGPLKEARIDTRSRLHIAPYRAI